METKVGRVIHYYPKISVAAVVLDGHIATGDRIRILGPHDDLHQSVTSMELNHVPVTEADRGQDIGIKVIGRVHEGDMVFRES
jgi:translation elongation factor EF-Tu-like GTPase